MAIVRRYKNPAEELLKVTLDG